ncbi:hypothetical protein D3C86_2080720 [compost metagenome]
MKKLVSESCIVSILLLNDFANDGNAGRYISIENGPIAVNNPSVKTTKNSLRLNCICYECSLQKCAKVINQSSGDTTNINSLALK